MKRTMRTMLNWIAVVSVLCVLLTVPVVAMPTNTFTGTFTSDHCTGQCLYGQPNGGGTVTITDNGAGTLSFSINLANGNQLINTGFDATLGFQLESSIPAVTYSAINPAANYSIPNSVGSTQTAGALHMDGLGDFRFGLEGIGNGGSDPLGNTLTFSITAAGLDLGDLTTNANGQILGADILSGTNGATGGIDVSGNPTPVPEASTLMYIGLGLLLVGYTMRRSSLLRVA